MVFQILNVSPNLQIAIYLKGYSSLPYFLSMMLKNISFPFTCTTSYLNLGDRFFFSHLSFTAGYSLKSEKIGLLILLNCEPASLTVFTTMCPKEQQTSDNLIVKDYCFIIEMYLIKDLLS